MSCGVVGDGPVGNAAYDPRPRPREMTLSNPNHWFPPHPAKRRILVYPILGRHKPDRVQAVEFSITDMLLHPHYDCQASAPAALAATTLRFQLSWSWITHGETACTGKLLSPLTALAKYEPNDIELLLHPPCPHNISRPWTYPWDSVSCLGRVPAPISPKTGNLLLL